MSRLYGIPLHELTAHKVSPRHGYMGEFLPERTALGSGPVGLGVACVYCLPALITAHTYRDGRACCHECACTNTKPRVPAFVLGEAA